MPLSGTLDVHGRTADLPRLASYDAEPWQIEGVSLLHLKFEIDEGAMQAPLPRALHPTIPPVVIFTVATYPDSPGGPFALAQLRIGSRASALPRGFLTRAYCDSALAIEALSSKWGFDVHPADVRQRRFHDRIEGAVTLDGREIMRAALLDPEPISGGDIQYVANINLCRSPDGGEPVLLQVDPDYTFHRAERGRPEVSFDAAAWRAEGVEPVWPVAASFAVVDTGFPRLRFVMDPDKPAMAGTRRLQAAT
jgi:hypothetical protein